MEGRACVGRARQTVACLRTRTRRISGALTCGLSQGLFVGGFALHYHSHQLCMCLPCTHTRLLALLYAFAPCFFHKQTQDKGISSSSSGSMLVLGREGWVYEGKRETLCVRPCVCRTREPSFLISHGMGHGECLLNNNNPNDF